MGDFRKIKKILGLLFLIFLFLVLFLGSFLFMGKPPSAKKIVWGVNFSQKQAQSLGLDWQELYLALLEDLGMKNLRISAHWDLLEPKKDEYYFRDLDWQIKTAQAHGAKIILIIGMKTGRWPECHIPSWAVNLKKEDQQREILEMIKMLVLRYKDSSVIKYWQIENEPFFPFGTCPWVDKDFLKKEVKLVKTLDSLQRRIIIADSGEGSFWIQAGRVGDLVGITLYKKVWVRQLGIYFHYPFPPIFYWRKAQLVRKLFGKEVICVELQAEPWGPLPLSKLSIQEQMKTMDLDQFRDNIKFAKATGLKEFYLWGSEWWYWMKMRGYGEFWEEAKKLGGNFH